MFLVVLWCPFLVVSNRCSRLLKSTLANAAGSVADSLQKMRRQQAACTALFADLGPDEWCAEFQLETAMLTFKQRLNNCLRVVLDKTTFPPDIAKQVRSCFVVGQSAVQVRDCSDRIFMQCVSVESVVWLQPYQMGFWKDVDLAPDITCMMCKLKMLLAVLMQSDSKCCRTSPYTIAGMWAMHDAPSCISIKKLTV